MRPLAIGAGPAGAGALHAPTSQLLALVSAGSRVVRFICSLPSMERAV